MAEQKLRRFLDEHQVKYVKISHSPAFTAQEIAASAHIPGKEVAKTVVVKVDGKISMAVLPASYRVDLMALAKAIGAEKANLAEEKEFRDKFGACEVGAMPPFGNLYDMDVYVAENLTEDKEIAFNAGSHEELIRMKYDDYSRLVRPRVVRFAVKD
jgi:Ala-tRNA(Pro) deacylase